MEPCVRIKIMKLLKVYKTEDDLIIDTSDGYRLCKLKHNGSHDVEALEAKCKLLIDKEVVTTALSHERNDIYFFEISEAFDEVADIEPLNDKILEELPIGKIFKNHTSQKIFGPPGTGKTYKLLKIIEGFVKNNVKPEDIAFISFSNAAANQAKKRVSDTFDDLGSVDFPNFSTMHSLATRIGGNRGMELCKEEHWKAFDSSIFCFKEWTEKNDPRSEVSRYSHAVLELYSLAISRETSIEEEFDKKVELSNKGDYFAKRDIQNLKNSLGVFFNKNINESNIVDCSQLYVDKYNEFKKSRGLVDFNDVILNTISKDFDDSQMPSFEVLIIDEAQDLSDSLWTFAKKLISKAGTVFVAGDDDQAIMINFGASAHAFLNLKVTEKDDPLKKSYRIGKKTKEYVDAGVMPVIEALPGRKPKAWTAANHHDAVSSSSKVLQFSENGEEADQQIEAKEIDINALLQIVISDKEKDWLIICPTRNTGEIISNALLDLTPSIPHFYRNKPKPNLEKIGASSIRVQTVHTSKGDQAKNVAIVAAGPGDISMLANDPRLAYVALTRSEEQLYPRVVAKGLLPRMMRDNYSTASKYMQMFPQKIKILGVEGKSFYSN